MHIPIIHISSSPGKNENANTVTEESLLNARIRRNSCGVCELGMFDSRPADFLENAFQMVHDVLPQHASLDSLIVSCRILMRWICEYMHMYSVETFVR